MLNKEIIDEHEISTICDILEEIGKIIVFSFSENLNFQLNEYILMLKNFLSKEFNKFDEEIEIINKEIETKKNVLLDENIMINSDNLKKEIEEVFYTFDRLVFIELGLQQIKKINNDDIIKRLDKFFNKIEEIYFKLYDWFYFDYEPGRLIPFNDIRKCFKSALPDWTLEQGLFPWYNLYVEISPTIFFDIAHNFILRHKIIITTQDEIIAIYLLKKDPVIRDFVFEQYSLMKNIEAFFNKNSYLYLFYLINEINFDILFDENIPQDLYQKYPAIAYKLLQQSKQIDDLILVLLFGPISYEKEYQLLNKYEDKLKKSSIFSKLISLLKNNDIKTLKQLIKKYNLMWIDKCKMLMDSVQMEYNENWYYEKFLKEIEQKFINYKDYSINNFEFSINLKEYYKQIKSRTVELFKKISSYSPLSTSFGYADVKLLSQKDKTIAFEEFLNLYEDDKLSLKYKIEKKEGTIFIFFRIKTHPESGTKIKNIKIKHNYKLIYPHLDYCYPNHLTKEEKDIIKLEYKEGVYILIIKFEDNSSLTFKINAYE